LGKYLPVLFNGQIISLLHRRIGILSFPGGDADKGQDISTGGRGIMAMVVEYYRYPNRIRRPVREVDIRMTRNRGYQGEKETGGEKSDFMPSAVTVRRER